jgi:hypothetical protein
MGRDKICNGVFRLLFVYGEYRFGDILQLCLWGKLYFIGSGEIEELGDVTSFLVGVSKKIQKTIKTR